MKSKIVLCTHRFLPRFMGGVEIYTYRLACAWQNMGQQVYILTGEPVPQKDLTVEVKENTYNSIPVIRLRYDDHKFPVTARAAYSDPIITAHLKAILQKLQPDLVHATSLSLLMGGTIEAALTLGLPFVYTATDFVLTCRRGTYLTWDNRICNQPESLAQCAACLGPHSPLEIRLNQLWQRLPPTMGRPLLAMAERLLRKKGDIFNAPASIAHRLNYLPYWRQQIPRLIAPSHYIRAMFILNGFPSERIMVAPYGVPLPETSEILKISEVGQPIRFSFIGRVTFIKGVHLLLEAFSQLPSQMASLTIYGEADVKADRYWHSLQQKGTALPNVKFMGRVDNLNISQIYQQTDLLVVPSIWPENSPITILEAQAHGVPIIASDVGGIADLVQHEVNGLIFANGNSADLATQLLRCVNEPYLVASLAARRRPVLSIETQARELLESFKPSPL